MNEIVQAEEHRAQGLMTLLARGLLESSAQKTASSLGDRSQYIGMSDIGRALVRNFTENGRVVRGKTATSRSEATLDFFLCL